MCSTLFSSHLFTHKYDIDDILAALCGPQPVWLETQSGTLSPTQPANIAPTHLFRLEPLPATFLHELAISPEVARLTTEEQTALHTLLSTLTIAGLGTQLHQPTRLSGWLRERLKEAALEWLDVHNLIPPSMRHINRQTAPLGSGARAVSITPTEE